MNIVADLSGGKCSNINSLNVLFRVTALAILFYSICVCLYAYVMLLVQ